MNIQELLQQQKYEEIIKVLQSNINKKKTIYEREYENARDIRDNQVGNRKKKNIEGNSIDVTKLPVPFQRIIVQTSSAFLFGNPLNITAKDTTNNTQNVLDKWDSLRLSPLMLKFAEKVKSTTEACIIFYDVLKDDKPIFKARLLDEGNLYPVFDEYGDMKAFGWEFTSKEGDKEVFNLYLFTDDFKYIFKKTDKWVLVDRKVNLFGKIPIVYQSQKHPDWHYCEDMIDRFEMTLSKFCDINDYFASPMFKAKGVVGNTPKKDDVGGVVKLDIVETERGNIINSDLDVIGWDRAPEAVELELKTLKQLIFATASVPDLSFENVKGIGSLSEASIKLMFLSPILKAKYDESDFVVSVLRILSIIKSGLLNIERTISDEEMSFDVEFTSVLPENLKEVVETLVKALEGGIISQQTATELNPMVLDVQEELSRIAKEKVENQFNSISESYI